MIKLGSTTINKIKLGNTTINKIYLGQNQVYPMGVSPPAETILENFEQNPPTGLYTDWYEFGASDPPTLARSSLHATQGSYSWKLNGSASIGYGFISNNPTLDVTPYIAAPTKIKVDVYIETLNAADRVALVVSDSGGVNGAIVYSSPGATGAITLTADISGTGVDYQDMVFQVGVIGADSAPLTGDFEIYIDNLRAS